MKNCSFNYVRTHRGRHAVTLKDVAFLIGHKSGSPIAQIERGDGPPSIKTALALQIVFGAAPRELFPGLYETVEDEVMRQGHAFRATLDGKTDPASNAKRDLIDEMAARSLANTIEA
jgi:transcriptional regulator with XRE-family HTH domain